MKAHGLHNFTNVVNGWNGIKKTDLPKLSSVPEPI